MTIVCGIDFSANATQAARAAAALAQRLNLPLKLVHVIEQVDVESISGLDALSASLQTEVRDRAAEIAASFGIDVEPIVLHGVAYETLVDAAHAHNARLIVVASLGDTKQPRWLVGSVAERVVQISPVPVLVVRESASIEAWTRGERPLRTMVGADLASTSKAALRWAAELHAIERCDLTVTHVAWPLGEHFRLGVPSPIPIDQLRPELHNLLMRDLQA